MPNGSSAALPKPPDRRILTPEKAFADAGNLGQLTRIVRLIDRFLAFVLSCGQWLALPIAVLLFLQWPLREMVGVYSREANDLGQWLFAFYVAMSITAATRAKVHLAADALARRYPQRWRDGLTRLGAAFGLIPWALFVLIASRNIVMSSVLMRESFPDTQNPGYFLIKAALWLLAAGMLIEGMLELVGPCPAGQE